MNETIEDVKEEDAKHQYTIWEKTKGSLLYVEGSFHFFVVCWLAFVLWVAFGIITIFHVEKARDKAALDRCQKTNCPIQKMRETK